MNENHEFNKKWRSKFHHSGAKVTLIYPNSGTNANGSWFKTSLKSIFSFFTFCFVFVFVFEKNTFEGCFKSTSTIMSDTPFKCCLEE